MSDSVTRLVVVIKWNGGDESYYTPEERTHLLERWITEALTDRDDHPEVVSFGVVVR